MFSCVYLLLLEYLVSMVRTSSGFPLYNIFVLMQILFGGDAETFTAANQEAICSKWDFLSSKRGKKTIPDGLYTEHSQNKTHTWTRRTARNYIYNNKKSKRKVLYAGAKPPFSFKRWILNFLKQAYSVSWIWGEKYWYLVTEHPLNLLWGECLLALEL